MIHVGYALILQGTVAADPAMLIVVEAAVVVAAVAIVLQTVMMVGTYRASRATKEQVSALAARIEPLTDSARHVLTHAQDLVSEVRGYAREYSQKGAEVLDLTRKQLVRVDEIMLEATARTRAQLDRVEMVLDDTMARFQETTALLQNHVLRPLRQVAGITSGVRTMMAALFGGHRPTVEQATHDEEMFI